MNPLLSCPNCQARLRVPADTTQTLFRCVICGTEFSSHSDEPEALDVIPLE